MKKLYLDVDEVILNKDLSPAKHLKDFLSVLVRTNTKFHQVLDPTLE